MCKETFLRLPEEKRNRFLDAAWVEFTTVPFAKASVNQIVHRAKIPRGSFYQYFTDKSDLFSYLQENVREQIQRSFQDLLLEAGGDIFRTVMAGFDRFLEERERGAIPLLDRCISVARINPGIDLEGLITRTPEDLVTEEIIDEMDLTALRQRDLKYVNNVCCLAGVCLGSAMMDTLHHPERGAECRRELAEKLEIIQGGCLKQAAEGGIAQ